MRAVIRRLQEARNEDGTVVHACCASAMPALGRGALGTTAAPFESGRLALRNNQAPVSAGSTYVEC